MFRSSQRGDLGRMPPGLRRCRVKPGSWRFISSVAPQNVAGRGFQDHGVLYAPRSEWKTVPVDASSLIPLALDQLRERPEVVSDEVPRLLERLAEVADPRDPQNRFSLQSNAKPLIYPLGRTWWQAPSQLRGYRAQYGARSFVLGLLALLGPGNLTRALTCSRALSVGRQSGRQSFLGVR